MKKQLIIFFLLILLCFPIVSKAVVTNSIEYDGTKIYVFYQESNENYEKEKQWLEDNTNIRKEYINTNENNELYTKVKDVLKIKKDKLPLTIIGSTYFIGFDEKTKNQINEAITSYENADQYGDVVEKIRNNEDVKDIVKQNEGIYKQPGTSNNILIIVLIIVVVFILICILKAKGMKKRPRRSQH